jgi:pimeloyl-ACP methyl ester carboxylesterase
MHASVQHAAAFLRQLARGPYHLVGNSRGAYLVCRVALENPELVKSCVLVSTSTLSPGLSRNPTTLANPPLPLQSRESQRWVYERYSFNTKIVTEDWLDETQAVIATERNQIAIRKMMQEGLEKSQYVPELRRQRLESYRWILERGMPCPTLVVCALNDPTTDFENMKLLIEMLMATQPQTEVRVFNRAGHYVYREQSPAFNGMLLDFIKSRG